jgi:hypothetical protein
MLTISGNWHLANSNSWCSYQSKHPTIYSCKKKNYKWYRHTHTHTWFLFAWFLLNRSVSFDLHNNLCTFHQIYLGRIGHCVFLVLVHGFKVAVISLAPYLKLYSLDLPCRPTKETSKSWIHSFCWGQNTLKLGTQFYLPGIETE